MDACSLRTPRLLSALALFFLLGLAACGDDQDDDVEDSSVSVTGVRADVEVKCTCSAEGCAVQLGSRTLRSERVVINGQLIVQQGRCVMQEGGGDAGITAPAPTDRAIVVTLERGVCTAQSGRGNIGTFGGRKDGWYNGVQVMRDGVCLVGTYAAPL